VGDGCGYAAPVSFWGCIVDYENQGCNIGKSGVSLKIALCKAIRDQDMTEEEITMVLHWLNKNWNEHE
jgi:hypothetical protein